MTSRNGSTAGIELRIRELSQLFNSLDPSPFHERELDDDAAAYIESWALELPERMPIRLVIHLPADEARKAEERAAAIERERHELTRMGWRYLSVGIAVLLVCFGASWLVRLRLGDGPLARALEESLIIVGWVANWKPLETFLYDGWPLRRRGRLYRRLARASVELQAH